MTAATRSRAAFEIASFSGALVTRSAVQAFVNNVTTLFTFDAETYDVGGYHDNAVNPSRLTVPAAGWYLVHVRSSWAANGVGWRYLEIRKNADGVVGAGTLIAVSQIAPSGAGDVTLNETGAVVQCNSGDRFEAFGFQNSGGNLNVNSAALTSGFRITRL